MKIAIFGGSFNPVHIMHKQIAQGVIDQGYVDKVIFVPTGNKYKKDYLIEDKYRLKMLEISIRNNEDLKVSDYELGEELKYTYQTLDYFQSQNPNDEIYFILGMDNLIQLKTWKRFDYLVSAYKFLVVYRDKVDVDNIKNEYKDYLKNIIFTNVKPHHISSRQIREIIKTDHYSDYVEKEVMDYIVKNKLYF